jgi:hypothetical protein
MFARTCQFPWGPNCFGIFGDFIPKGENVRPKQASGSKNVRPKQASGSKDVRPKGENVNIGRKDQKGGRLI